MGRDIFQRTEMLLGEEVMRRISSVKIIIFGIGGVGGWCSEALVRAGVTRLTIVDPDFICPSNLNRQLVATSKTIGRAKVEVLKERLLDINPEACINALQEAYSEEKASCFELDTYDYIIDAIDTLSHKTSLILKACETGAALFSSMGAALKVDPCRVRVAEFMEIRGCPLAAAIRKKMKRAGTLPSRKFLCVYDDEVLPNLGKTEEEADNSSIQASKAVINGTTAPVTGVFGFTLSGLVLKDLYEKQRKNGLLSDTGLLKKRQA